MAEHQSRRLTQVARPLLLAALFAGAPAASAQAEDPLAAVTSRDPMELARVVAREGDGLVLAHLAEQRPRRERLAAIYASPWMRGPEEALPQLGEMARGRDPELAPAAALAATQIARRIDGGTLAARESTPDALTGSLEAFAALANDDTARGDLRAAARVVVAQLREAGVPAP